MKHKLPLWMIASALAGILFNLTEPKDPQMLSALFSFPLGPLADLMRGLSLQGGLSNALAWLIFLSISLLPGLVLVMLHRRRSLVPEDWLLAGLIPLLAFVQYRLINPSAAGLGSLFGGPALNPLILSVLLGYLILRFLRHLDHTGADHLYRLMTLLLHILVIGYVFILLGPSLAALRSDLGAIAAGNIGSGQSLAPTMAVIVLKHLIAAVPMVMMILIALEAASLLDSLNLDDYPQAVTRARRISGLARTTLIAVVLANIGYHMLQLALAASLVSAHWSIQLPLDLLLLLLGALLFARHIETLHHLQTDNDLFI